MSSSSPPPPQPNSSSAPVHGAVAAGKSAEEVRRVIEEACAQGGGGGQPAEGRRAAAVNQAASSNETPLQAAHRLGRGDLVGLLLESGADVQYIFDGRATALAVCALYGQVGSLRALLRAGADANEKFPYNWYGGFDEESYCCTAVHLCLSPRLPGKPQERPQLEALEVLVREGGADVDGRDEDGATPLMWLPHAQSDHEAALDLLLRLGADVNARKWSKRGKPLSEPDESPLLSLLSDPLSPGLTQLLLVRKLVGAGAQTSGIFDQYGRTPLAAAVDSHQLDVVRYLLEEVGVPVDERNPKDGRTAMHQFFASSEDLAMLLDAGADIEARDNQGRTPLFVHAGYPDPEKVQLLLERGASIDARDNKGGTPLMSAFEDSEDSGGWPFLANAEMAELVLRHTSPETQKAVRASDGFSALDCVVEELFEQEDYLVARFLDDAQRQGVPDPVPPPLHEYLGPPQQHVIAEMLAAGVPFLPENAETLLPTAVSRVVAPDEQARVELAARRSEGRRWRAHEDVVGLALDARAARAVEAEVQAAEARVAALERGLREMESGSDSESEGESDSDSDSGSGSDSESE